VNGKSVVFEIPPKHTRAVVALSLRRVLRAVVLYEQYEKGVNFTHAPILSSGRDGLEISLLRQLYEAKLVSRLTIKGILGLGLRSASDNPTPITPDYTLFVKLLQIARTEQDVTSMRTAVANVLVDTSPLDQNVLDRVREIVVKVCVLNLDELPDVAPEDIYSPQMDDNNADIPGLERVSDILRRIRV